MKYSVYNNDNVIALYEGENPPILTPNIPISDADFEMAKSNYENFKVKDNTLIPLNSQEYYLRIKRDFLLKESDKYILVDYPITEDKRNEWKIYRKQLRDMLENCDVNNPIFPTIPQ